MYDEIRKDTVAQVARFAAQLVAVLDPEQYPTPNDGPTFDTDLRALDGEFVRVKRVFHDCLMAQWSEDIGRGLQQQLATKKTRKRSDGDVR